MEVREWHPPLDHPWGAGRPATGDYVTYTRTADVAPMHIVGGTITVGPEKMTHLNELCGDPPYSLRRRRDRGPHQPLSRETWIKMAGTIGLFVYMAAVYFLASYQQ